MEPDRIRFHLLYVVLPCCLLAPLPEQPSTEKPLHPRLQAMNGLSWLHLEPEGMAKARMYSGACFGGGYLWYFGGAHRSYPGNEVELYDPRANEWIQATASESPPRGSPDWKALISGGGTTKSISPKGRPYTEHTYQQVCWQPGRKRFFVVLLSSGTWEFDPEKREWIHLIDRFRNPERDPRGSWAQNHVLYEPAFGAPVLVVGSGGDATAYRFEHQERSWKRLGPIPQELKWNEFYSTYVPEWKSHLISTMKKAFFRFDVPNLALTPMESPDVLHRSQVLSYDAANQVVLALAVKKVSRYRQTVIPWALDVQSLKWKELHPSGQAPVGQTAGAWATLWYDPAHNVHLLVNCVQRDRNELFDGGVTQMWALRLGKGM